MANGHLRERAIEIITGGVATVDEKLDLLLQITLDNIDSIETVRKDMSASIEVVRKDVNANPLAWIPETWRKRVAVGATAWFAWVSLEHIGIPVSIPTLLDWLNKLK